MDFAGTDQAKDKRQLEEIFVLSNSSGNGLLSIAELQSVLELMGKRCQQHEALSMVASVNSRATNDLNFEEFVKLMDVLIDRPYTEAEIEEAFQSLSAGGDDADGKFISAERFRVRNAYRRFDHRACVRSLRCPPTKGMGTTCVCFTVSMVWAGC